jgi:hypothetical protein
VDAPLNREGADLVPQKKEGEHRLPSNISQKAGEYDSVAAAG